MWRSITAFRWLALAWLTGVAVAEPAFEPRVATFALVIAIGVWTLGLTRQRKPPERWILVGDLAVCFTINLATGLLAPPGRIETVSMFGLVYSYVAVFSVGGAYGPGAGAAGGLAMSVSYLLSIVMNGVGLQDAVIVALLLGTVGPPAAGLALGLISNLLHRLYRATAEAIDEGQRAARLEERESMARQIHDSVLQVLALIHKRGMELSESDSPGRQDIAELAGMARDQEVALRGLFLRSEPTAPAGEASLRSALEAAVAPVRDLEVVVSAVGPVWLPRRLMSELVAAVSEAMANVAEHSGATRVTVFADEVGGEVQVTVRDNGSGFDFDEGQLRSQGKFGVLNSMKGRVEALGGKMSIESSPGRGTEVEFRVPARSQRAGVRE